MCFIGFYPLFYKLNKPVSRLRSIALFAAVLLGYPLYMLLNNLYSFGRTTPSIFDIFIPILALFLLSFVLLGNNRLRVLVSASFAFGIIHLVQFPVVYFTAAVIHPVTDMDSLIDALYKSPLLLYGSIFFFNIIIIVSCLLAAHWLRKTKQNPPLKLCVFFISLFVLFTLIVLLWWDDFAMVKSISFLSSSFMGVLFIIILLSLFYIYTRLTAKNSLSLSTTENDKYMPFIAYLSKRELEVIESILSGNVSHKALASNLSISVNTVKTHLKHIYQITGVSNIASLSFLFQGYASK